MKRLKQDDTGVALIVTLLILMLMAGLMAGFFAAVNADTRSNALDKDQTRAYAAAHAGLEKLTSDLATLFNGDVSPSVSQINALLLYPPAIPGYEYRAPGGAANSGYSVTWKADVNGNPAPDDVSGSAITAGNYRGLKGIITKYPITVTARSLSGGAEVRLRRELQTVAVPVFQFGLFSQTDLSFFAGPNFNFGGRIHTNGTLFLAEGDNNTLTLSDRVTAAGEIIRWQLSNGFLTSTAYQGNVNVVQAQGGGLCCAGWTLRDLERNEGSLVNGPGSAANEPKWTPLSIGTYKSYIRSRSTGASQLNLPVVSQGATPIDLIKRPPTVNEDTVNTPVFVQRLFSQASLRILLSDRAVDITNATLPTVTATAPVPLNNWAVLPVTVPVLAPVTPIARSIGPMAATTTLNGNPTGAEPNMIFPVNGAVPALLQMPPLQIPGQPNTICTGRTPTSFIGCTLTATVPNNTAITAVVPYGPGAYTHNAATSTTGASTPAGAGANRTIPVTNTNGPLPFSRNFFWVNGTAIAPIPPPTALVSCTGYTNDLVTPLTQFTGCSWSGVRTPGTNAFDPWTISTNAITPQDTDLNGGFIKIEKQTSAGVWSDVTSEILNLGFADVNSEGNICADPTPNAVIRIQRLRDNGGVCDTNPANPYDYWPNALYDTREGDLRDGVALTGAGSAMTVGGVMNYIAIDMANLKRWFAGNIGATGNQAWNQNGYIVYFSDRRGNHNPLAAVANAETGEYGFEDMVNRASAAGTPDAALEAGEDVNGNLLLDRYGEQIANCAGCIVAATGPSPYDANARPWITFTSTTAGNPASGNPAMARVNKQVLFRRALKLVNGGINAGVNNLPTSGLTVVAENPVYVQGNYNATGVSATANPNVPAAIMADAVTLLSNQWRDSASFLAPNDPTDADAANPTNGRQVTAPAAYRMAVAAGKTLSFLRPTVGGPAQDYGTDGGVHNFLRYLEDWNGQTLTYNGSIVSLWISRQATGTYKCCVNVYGPPTRAYTFDTNFLLPSLLPPGTPMFRDVNTLTFRQILRPTQ